MRVDRGESPVADLVVAREARATFSPASERGVDGGRLVIVSNRLPVTARLGAAGVELVPSTGGLATGLRDVFGPEDAVWVGWSGLPASIPDAARRELVRLLHARSAVGVPLSPGEVAGYYERFANGTLWPVLHDRADAGDSSPADWADYRVVNERFADVVSRILRPGDRVWVHDYHLMLLPRLLRARFPTLRIGFFLHTPFPELASLRAVRQHAVLLDGLLGADAVGMHTPAYAGRFVDAVDAVLGRRIHARELADGDRRVRVHASAMSIDPAAFAARAEAPETAAQVAELRREGEQLVVGVDRLDYTKGIPERLRAFAALLGEAPELRGRVRLVQLAVPSREDVPAYRAVRAEVEELVAAINARFSAGGWTPVEYAYRSVDPTTLAALYRAADVMVVTPLRDGMNLVAKEFVASRSDGDGVLVLSEHAGAAGELRAALLVDPTDRDQLVGALRNALTMPATERRVRMRRLRGVVRRHDVHQWARECLLALGVEREAAMDRGIG